MYEWLVRQSSDLILLNIAKEVEFLHPIPVITFILSKVKRVRYYTNLIEMLNSVNKLGYEKIEQEQKHTQTPTPPSYTHIHTDTHNNNCTFYSVSYLDYSDIT